MIFLSGKEYQMDSLVLQPPVRISNTNFTPGKVFDSLDISENTRKEYQYRVTPFLSFIQKNGFSINSFLEYKRQLAKRTDIGISTKNKLLVVARIYCKELQRQGFLPTDITQNIKSFQQSRKHKRDGLSEEEVQKVLNYVQGLDNNYATCRKKALLSLLILQGLRQIEIVRLDVTDLDLASQHAFIKGKGLDDKELIDLHPVTALALREYVKKWTIADGALFVSTSNFSRNQRLTPKSIRNIIKPILNELGIEKTVHGFRHYFTSKLILAYKGDLLTVAKYTRHKNLEMLQVYNDNIKHKADLPKYYETFDSIEFDKTEAQQEINTITVPSNYD